MDGYQTSSTSELFLRKSTTYPRMIFLGLIVMLPSSLSGMNVVFPAIAIPQMDLSLANASWFGSVACLTAPIGSILTGVIIDKCGRRAALLCSILPCMVGWFLLYLSYNWTIILTGEILIGVTSGTLGFPAQVYAGECIMVNHVRLRNNFLSWHGIGLSVGMCVVLLMGSLINYKQIAAIVTVFSLTLFVLIYFCIPESPSWLYLRGRIGDAEWSQKKLGIYQPILHRDRDRDRDATSAGSQTIENEPLFRWSSIKMQLKKIRRKDVYTPLIVMSVLFLLLSFSGGIAVITYLVDTIGEISPTGNSTFGAVDPYPPAVTRTPEEDAYKYSAISGVLMLAANCLVCAVVGSLGVNKILSASSIFMGFGFAILGYTTTRNSVSPDLVALHIFAVWLVTFTFNFGIMNLPNAVLGDVFPIDAKGFASVVCVVEYLLTALLLKIHPYMGVAFGGYLYYGYAMISILAAVYVNVCMKEIVGKTLEQINKEYLQ